MQTLEKERVALSTALDVLDGSQQAEQPAHIVVKAEAGETNEGVGGDTSVTEADQAALLQACMFPLYE